MAEEYETKSVIIGKKGASNKDGSYPIFVNLFDENEPHKDHTIVPKKFLEFEGIHKIIIKNLEVEYLLVGKDIVINNLKKIHVDVDSDGHIFIDGVQE